MSTKKSEKNKKASKGGKSQEDKSSPEPSEPSLETSAVIYSDIRKVSINVNYFRNILALYPVSDIRVSLKYLDQNVGESEPIPVCDEKLILNKSFDISVDVNSPKELDALASNAIFITAVQSSGAVAPELYEQLQESEENKQQEPLDSLFSMYEAFNGEKPTVELVDDKKKKKDKKEKAPKEKPKSEARPKSAMSRASKMSKKSSQSAATKDGKARGEAIEIKSEIYGMCALDLIPLFYGEKSFSETLVIKPIYRSCEVLSTFKNFPEVSITVSVDSKLIDIKNIMHFTVESICNAPSLMLSDLNCRICVQLPLLNKELSPTIFHNPRITTKEPKKVIPKRWPGIQDIGYNANTTKYFIDGDIRDITNKANLNLEEGLKEEATRIEFNYLKRNIMFKSSHNDFATRVFSHKKLVLEIFATTGGKLYDSISEEHNTKSKEKIPHYLHLMAVLDIVALLYPGVTRLHIAAPITTFTYDEATKNGLEDSYFLPKPTDQGTSKIKLDTTKKKKGDKKESSKKDKESGAKDDKNLASKLPPKPEEPVPSEASVQIYNEEGKPCFLIVELELLKPITPKKNEEELKSDLYALQMQALQTSKTVLNKNVADKYYSQTIKEIVNDLNKNWIQYQETKTIAQSHRGDFQQYLQKIGAYQIYLHSITTSATLLITNKYKCEEQDFKNDKNYQNLISEVFLDLISQMHSIVNTLVCSGMKYVEEKPSTTSEVSLFYAKEAAELKLYDLAERYFLERIINNEEANPDCWFDYAIFNLENNDPDKAFESAKESMAMKCTNKYLLLLYGVLLAEKENIHDAEICFLNVLILEARWVEGWGVLYLFYQKCGRLDGMEMALETATKLLEKDVTINYFHEFEDLAWNWKVVPDTIFFRTAIVLFKMRIFSWAELALAEEVLFPKHYGYVNYMLAAISYYKKEYEHALEHIEEAKQNLGGNCAILALSGHILYAQGKFEKAKEEYLYIIDSYDRPDDIHLVYSNCADILAKLGEDQKARKFILVTCKYHQTPHVWFTLGKLYFQQNDLLSAEECFNEANMLDNRHSQVWAYLTLVNLKLNRTHEAEQCYQQAVKSKLDDEELNKRIIEEFNKVNKLQ